ncbi:MAG: matrixin family metalloprotease [Peptococcaceae bacterium]|nr:matrixin family metalloprotease [Peptococcaceae bacterium]
MGIQSKGVLTRWFFLLFTAILIIFSFYGTAQGMTLYKDLKQLTEEADYIFIGKVIGLNSQWNDTQTQIQTTVNILVEENLKNKRDSSTISITVPGGEVNGIIQRVTDIPVFTKNEKIVLFLDQKGIDKFEVCGGSQGKLSIKDGKVSNKTLNEFKHQINSILKGEPSGVDIHKAATEPTITNITPNKASAGTNTQITISGSGFGSTPGHLWFFFQGDNFISNDYSIVSWSDSSIVSTVPIATIYGYSYSASSGPVYVETADGLQSNYFPFEVTFSYGGAKWPGGAPVLTYRINPNTPDYAGEENAVINAANTWNTVPGKTLTFNYGGSTTATNYSYNGSNEVLWKDLGSTSTLAFTCYWYSGQSLLEADIVFNDYYIWNTEYDIQSIALHELGHVLGLLDLYGDYYYPDTPHDVDKVMFGFNAGETKRTLHTDDQAGIQWIYPLPARGNLEIPTEGATISGTTIVSGWLLDGNGVSKIEVLVDGILKGQATYGDSRPDVYNAFPEYGNSNAGFHFSLDTTTLANGSHTITIRETANNGSQNSLAPRVVNVFN